MDETDKQLMKNDVGNLKSLLGACDSYVSHTNLLANRPNPIMGPIVTVVGFATVANGMQSQNEVMKKIVSLIEKLIEKA